MPRAVLDEVQIHPAIRARVAKHQADIVQEVQRAVAARKRLDTLLPELEAAADVSTHVSDRQSSLFQRQNVVAVLRRRRLGRSRRSVGIGGR